MLYPDCMFKFNVHFVILLPVLLFLILTTSSDFRIEESSVVSQAEVVTPGPCDEMQVTSAGVDCRSKIGLVARLAFPQVNLKNVLVGDEFLPEAENVFTADEKK